MMQSDAINIDITHRCRLQCPKCMRSLYPNLHKRGHDISIENMQKISSSFKTLYFCGQMGDPIYHPQFDSIIELCKNNDVVISTNGSGKDFDWFERIHNIKPNIAWNFGLDGLPEQSHLYRRGQDGVKVFEVMKRLAAIGGDVAWQYIIFRYNENNIDEAKALAKKHKIKFYKTISSRWSSNDPLKPLNKQYYHDKT